jgi:serine/threonine protein kinase
MYLHKNDIVHRDVKMENILLQSNLTVKLIDFGFSIRLKNNELLHDFCGTPHYIAP